MQLSEYPEASNKESLLIIKTTATSGMTVANSVNSSDPSKACNTR